MRKFFRIATVGALLSAFAAQAETDQPPLPPPYEGVYQPKGVDEIGIWGQDDEDERELAASPQLIRDERLRNYVHYVLCETVGNDRCKAVRTYILREPSFNASMSPNGTMRVYSGLLLRMRSEAELATVLGHEFGHFENRHGLNEFKKRRTAGDLLAWSAVLTAIGSNAYARRHYRDLRISVYGNLHRYNRNQEREADLLGLSYLNASQYRPQVASRVWVNLIRESEASARHKGLRKPRFDAIAFSASHPPKAERASYLELLADPAGDERDEGAERYRTAMEPWLPMFLEDQAKLNDFGATEFILENLAEDGWTAPLLYARGELYRRRGTPRELVHAVQFYGDAVAIDPDHAGAYRGLGLSLIKTGNRIDGQDALARYLELDPQASDAKMIKLMLPR